LVKACRETGSFCKKGRKVGNGSKPHTEVMDGGGTLNPKTAKKRGREKKEGRGQSLGQEGKGIGNKGRGPSKAGRGTIVRFGKIAPIGSGNLVIVRKKTRT